MILSGSQHVEILSMRDRPRFDTDWIVGQLDPTDPIHRLMSSVSKISHVFLEASSAQSCPETVTASRLNSWIDIGKMLDADMIDWTHNVPEDWQPFFIESSSAEEPFITYRALPLAVVWNYYRAIRIVLQKLMLELRQIRAVFFGPAPDDMEALEIIQQMITGVCRSMAYCLGDVDMHGNRMPSNDTSNRPRVRAFHGYTLLWPIWYVLSCGLATPEQEKLVRDVLLRVGSALGIKLALTLADYDYSMLGGFERFVSDMGV